MRKREREKGSQILGENISSLLDLYVEQFLDKRDRSKRAFFFNISLFSLDALYRLTRSKP